MDIKIHREVAEPENFSDSPRDDEEVVLKSRRLLLEIAPSFILLALIFFLPLLFIPSAVIHAIFAKSMVIGIGVLLTFGLWILLRLKEGKFTISTNKLFLVCGIVLLTQALSALFSPVPRVSFLGLGFEIGTVSLLALMFLLMFLVTEFFRSHEKIFYAYIAFLAAFFILTLFHIIRFFGGADVLSFGFFTATTVNTVGSWNDLGIFFGLGLILALTTLELLELPGKFRIMLLVALFVSVFFLALVNFQAVWYVVGIFSLIFFVYFLSYNVVVPKKSSGALLADDTAVNIRTGHRKIPIISLVLVIVSFFFIIGSSQLSSMISGWFGISVIEARPNWTATWDIAKSTLKEDPMFGIGPNRFASKWVMYKSTSINADPVFWNTDFNFGIGFIPSSLVTSGLLGFGAWVLFFATFVYLGVKSNLREAKDKFSRYLILSSFLAALYLWIFAWLYVPSVVILMLAFFFTGLFIASLIVEKQVSQRTFSFVESTQKSFIIVLASVLILIATITWGYTITKKFIASVYFQKALLSFSSGNTPQAEAEVARAVEFGRDDVYYRYLSQLNVRAMNAILNQEGLSQESRLAQLGQALQIAIQNAKNAVAYDDTNYQNYINLAGIYEAVVPLKVQDAYPRALEAYGEALKRNPQSPAIYLLMARLHGLNANYKEAREYVAKSIALKNNYADAYFLLSQIEVAEGNIKGAISSVESAVLLNPRNPNLYFQLGLLNYNNKSYTAAVLAFENAVMLEPSYANARYFLGLSYDKRGKTDDAITQFEILEMSNPENAEIKLILSNLKNGRAPLSEAKPPLNTEPEKRKELPLKEADKEKKAENEE